MHRRRLAQLLEAQVCGLESEWSKLVGHLHIGKVVKNRLERRMQRTGLKSERVRKAFDLLSLVAVYIHHLGGLKLDRLDVLQQRADALTGVFVYVQCEVTAGDGCHDIACVEDVLGLDDAVLCREESEVLQ